MVANGPTARPEKGAVWLGFHLTTRPVPKGTVQN